MNKALLEKYKDTYYKNKKRNVIQLLKFNDIDDSLHLLFKNITIYLKEDIIVTNDKFILNESLLTKDYIKISKDKFYHTLNENIHILKFIYML